MEFISVYRFSNTGFEAQLQTFHLKQLKWYATGKALREWDEQMKNYFAYETIRNDIIKKQKELNYDFAKGVWVFIGDECDHSLSDLLLNHLPKGKKKHLSFWTAKLPKTAVVYDTNDLTGGVFSKNNIKLLSEVSISAFVPHSSLHLLDDIKQCPNPYAN